MIGKWGPFKHIVSCVLVVKLLSDFSFLILFCGKIPSNNDPSRLCSSKRNLLLILFPLLNSNLYHQLGMVKD